MPARSESAPSVGLACGHPPSVSHRLVDVSSALLRKASLTLGDALSEYMDTALAERVLELPGAKEGPATSA